MDLDLSPTEEAFRQEFAGWLRANLPEELTSSRVRALPEQEALAARKTWERKLGEGGWLGVSSVSWPAAYGGRTAPGYSRPGDCRAGLRPVAAVLAIRNIRRLQLAGRDSALGVTLSLATWRF